MKSIKARLRGGIRRNAAAGKEAKPSGPRRAAGGSNVARGPQIHLGGLEHLTGYAVRRAQAWIFQDIKRALKSADITPAQFAVMKIVAANSGIVQARVAEVLAMERARLVEMLDRLEGRRLIARARSQSDRRTHALQLTQEGAALLERLDPLIAAHEQHVVERIGADDKRQLLRILGALLR